MATSKKNEASSLAKSVQPRVARGKGIIRTDEEIDKRFGAEALERRLDTVVEDWKENAPREFRELIEAGEVE